MQTFLDPRGNVPKDKKIFEVMARYPSGQGSCLQNNYSAVRVRSAPLN